EPALDGVGALQLPDDGYVAQGEGAQGLCRREVLGVVGELSLGQEVAPGRGLGQVLAQAGVALAQALQILGPRHEGTADPLADDLFEVLAGRAAIGPAGTARSAGPRGRGR